MRIPTYDQLILAGESLMKWGFWFVVYGAIAMIIGLVIILIVNDIANKPVKLK